MRVRIERSGGFANVRATASAETDPADINDLLRIARESRAHRPDDFTYHVELEHEDGSRETFDTSDPSLFEWAWGQSFD